MRQELGGVQLTQACRDMQELSSDLALTTKKLRHIEVREGMHSHILPEARKHRGDAQRRRLVVEMSASN